MLSNACSPTFPRSVRLTEGSQYRRAFSKGIRSSDSAFTLLACANPDGYARLGLAISKKNARRAVARHRLKRLIRESFRVTRRQLPPIDIVVLARPVAQTLTNAEISSILNTHWRRLRKRWNAG